MLILGGNRRLLWVIVPAIVWAWLGVSIPLGMRPQDHAGLPPFRVELGPAAGGVTIEGRLGRLAEDGGVLFVTVETPNGPPLKVTGPGGQEVHSLPPGLRIEQVAPGTFPAGPPELRLQGGMREARHLPGGNFGVLTERFLVRYNDRHVHVVPRPSGLRPPRPGEPGGPEANEPGVPGPPQRPWRDFARHWLKRRTEERGGKSGAERKSAGRPGGEHEDQRGR